MPSFFLSSQKSKAKQNCVILEHVSEILLKVTMIDELIKIGLGALLSLKHSFSLLADR